MLSCGVRLSVTFVYSVKTSKHIFKNFHHLVDLPLQVFHIKNNIPTGTPLTRVSNAGRVGKKSRFSTNIWFHRVLSTVRPPSVIHTAEPDRGKLVTLIAGSGVVCCWRETDEELFLIRSLNVTLETTEQNLCTLDEYEAKVIMYCALAKLTTPQTRNIARPLCDNRASCSYRPSI